ncbi:uncharacterized protein LOC135367991 isoform X2 [Ornithodoros turicata]|uniref:uncharacterized protein LOC135367991 isoform X2 n=1 Tax=Ornithodoros turicata TaxID=34597 RepID=UPI003139903A
MTPRLVGSRQKQRNRVRFVIQMPRWHLQEGDAQAGSPEGTAGRTSTRTRKFRRGLMISGTLGLFVLAFIVAIFISWNFLTQNSDENPEEKFIVTDAPKDRDPCINGKVVLVYYSVVSEAIIQGASATIRSLFRGIKNTLPR